MNFFGQYPIFYETTGTALLPNRLRQRHRAIIEQYEEKFHGARVLDMASHDGRWSFAALKAGAARVVGVEARAELVTRAEGTFRHYGIAQDSYTFICADAVSSLAFFQKGSFDVVLCLGFFYHTLRHIEIMEQIARIGPQHVIIDTAVSPLAHPVIELTVEDHTDVRNAVDHARTGRRLVPIGNPSRAAIACMADYVGYRCTELDWCTLDPDWTECEDYQSRTRSTFLCSLAA